MTNNYTSNQSEQFKDKIIIVTGSTQGSGAETAKLLASRGAKGITICGRNNEKGNKVSEGLKESLCKKYTSEGCKRVKTRVRKKKYKNVTNVRKKRKGKKSYKKKVKITKRKVKL